MPGKRYAHLRKLYFITEDRILVHLLDYIGREGELSQPDDITQFGIAGAIGLGRSTVSKAIRRLEGQGFITAQRAHVPAGKLRRTVYLLTVAGTSKAKHRRLEIEEDAIAFRDAQGVDRRLRVGEVPRLLPEYASLLDVMAHVARGVFDAATYEPQRRQRFVDLTDAVPRLRYFFGRVAELAAMDAFLASPSARVLVIQGITGIGKTTLLSRKIEGWRGTHHILFHRVMEWTTLRNVLQRIAELLTRVGKKDLSHYLEAKPTADIEEVVSIIAGGLAGAPAVLVYDDVQNAERPIQTLFTGLRAALDGVAGVKLIVAGRRIPPFYDRRDVRVRGTVHEMPLAGLDLESSAQLLDVRNLALARDETEALHRLTRGHPLFLELVDSGSLSQAKDVHKYLEEELLARITDAEAKVLTIASVFRYPVHADGLFADDAVHAATVRGLVDQSLLREVASHVYEVHDALRMFFHELMTPIERRRYHRWAAQFLLSRPDGDSLEALYHLVEGEETTGAARLAVKDGRAILRNGRSEELLRLLERLLPTVEDLAQSAELRLLKAHILNVRGELDQAVGLYGEILLLPDEPALQIKVAEAHRFLGDILRRQNRQDEAEQHLEAALRLYRSLQSESGQAESLLSMGQLAEDRADYARAEKSYEKAIEIAHELHMDALEADLHDAFSRILVPRGDFTGALDRKQRGLAIAEGLADWHLQARMRVAMGTILFELKRYDEAMRAYGEGIETARRIGDLRMLAYGLYNAVGTHIRQNELMRAESYLRECEDLFRRLREPVMEALVLYRQGTLYEMRGKWQLAKHNFRIALSALSDGGHDMDFARTAIHASFYFTKNGERANALALLEQAQVVGKRIRAPGIVGDAERNLAEILRVEKDSPSGRTTPERASFS